MHFDDSFIQQVKEAYPLKRLLSEYVNLERNGKHMKAYCPMPDHINDSNPSFTYYEHDDSAYCYGCETDIVDSIDFLRKVENYSFQGAVLELAERANLDVSEQRHDVHNQEESFRDKLKDFARDSWIELQDEKNKFVKNYLHSRGVTDNLIREFKIGYAVGDAMEYKEFKSFYKRILLPIHNSYGDIVGFGGRIMPSQAGDRPKYYNSSGRDNPLFNKKELIYGLHKAKSNIRKKGYAIIVEGFFDVIMFHKYGLDNTVACMGAFTDTQMNKLKRHTDTVYLFMDPDEAGYSFVTKSARKLREKGVEVKIVEAVADPADIAQKQQENLKQWLKLNLTTPESYIVDMYLSEYNSKVSKARSTLYDQLKRFFGYREIDPETEVALNKAARELELTPEMLLNMIKYEEGGDDGES